LAKKIALYDELANLGVQPLDLALAVGHRIAVAAFEGVRIR
jgi:hypothetical protein